LEIKSGAGVQLSDILRRGLVLGFVLGLLWAGVQLAMDTTLPISHFSEYSDIRLGMDRQEVLAKLQKHEILCSGDTPECEFSDTWREFHVHFRSDGRVNRKFFVFKNRATPFRPSVD
jgi:hypothetical protein